MIKLLDWPFKSNYKFGKRTPETDPEAIELRRQFHKARPRGKQPLVPPEGIKDKTHLLGLKRKPKPKADA